MRRRCYKCGIEQELIPAPKRQVLHSLAQLRTPLEIVDPFMCVGCGREISSNIRFVVTDKHVVPTPRPQGQPAAERRNGLIWGLHRQSAMALNYPAVSTPGGNVLFPANEGRLSGGHAIGQYGDPDLMAELSAEYLKQYWVIVPKGRLPNSMVEMMPALNLLTNSAELAFKADLIRSGRASGGHNLRKLYGELENEHREKVQRRFADAAPNMPLNALGAERPAVESVLSVYDETFGGSSVYQDARYFAEPTTMLRSASLKGGTLVKDTPYPIFLPVIVQTMLDVYGFFAGAERLKRLGADVAYGTRDPGNDQHGSWGLVPSSIGLLVIRVAQKIAWDEQLEDRDHFRSFKAARPPGYSTSWMYGGQSLLFYRTGKDHPEDCETVIDGLECKVWYSGRLGMHARDLYLLANALRDQNDFPLFQWANNSSVGCPT